MAMKPVRDLFLFQGLQYALYWDYDAFYSYVKQDSK